MSGAPRGAAAELPGADSRVPLSLHSMIGTKQPPQQENPQQQRGRGQDSQKRVFEPYHSKSVPKSENLRVSSNDSRCSRGPVTTMMLRNIPNKYTQNTMMEEMDDLGFGGSYDFFYLPMDVHNRSNVGYAFINFLSPPDAQRFHDEFKEHRFRKHQSRKISSVSVAYVQGLNANLRHFENRAVTHARNDLYRPVVLKDGARVDFEEAVAEAVAAAGGSEAGREPTSSQPASLPDSPVVRSAREDFEQALRGYLMSRQNSADSTATGSAGHAPVPPGLEGAQAGAAWGRQSSAPATFHSGHPAAPPPAVAATPPRVRSVSAGSSPMLSYADAPAYVPLPSIPSASKLCGEIEACDDDGENPEVVFDEHGPWQVAGTGR